MANARIKHATMLDDAVEEGGLMGTLAFRMVKNVDPGRSVVSWSPRST